MKNSQFTIDEMLSVLRRRKRALLIPPIVIISLCVVGAFTLPRQYESSTTIMVQPNAVLGELLSYINPGAGASASLYSNPVGDLNEIIYSRPVIECLIDSLGIRPRNISQFEENNLVEKIRKKITTRLPGDNSFVISYLDPDPARAQRAVSVLTNLFIQHRIETENRRNQFAVRFFENKVNELQDRFLKSQDSLISFLKARAAEMPAEDRALLYGQLASNNAILSATEAQISKYTNSLNAVIGVLDQGVNPNDIQSLYQLQLDDIPFSGELKSSLDNYDQLSQRYTSRYPGLSTAKRDVENKLEKVRDGLTTAISQDREQLIQLEQKKVKTAGEIEQATVSSAQNQWAETSYYTYKDLYESMKVNLERVRTTRDLEQKAAEQVVVVNPPLFPTKPSKPNRKLIVGGGIGLGLFFGLLAAGMAELLDTRVRTPKDLEMFDRPIIAYLPAPSMKVRN